MREIKRAKLFTMVEMIVVIAILMILMSFVVPSLSKARARAKSVLCKNNLRQIGQVAISFASTNGELMPASFGQTSHGELNHWINYLHHIEG